MEKFQNIWQYLKIVMTNDINSERNSRFYSSQGDDSLRAKLFPLHTICILVIYQV